MELNREVFNLNNAVEEAVGIVKPLADKKSINISVNAENKNINIDADKRKIHQVLYNLLSNAIKFTGENGNIKLNLLVHNDIIELSIKDNGIGIAPEFHEKIFEKFQQVKATCPEGINSTGLGLTITRELIEMHGGSIRVESEIDNGANFIFTIPIKERRQK
jgi:signal transduction histidine kinase